MKVDHDIKKESAWKLKMASKTSAWMDQDKISRDDGRATVMDKKNAVVAEKIPAYISSNFA